MNGIGGRTLEEAKDRLSYQEFLTWLAFRKKRGTLHQGMRMEEGFALLAAMYANAHSKNGGHRLSDFMPHGDEPELTLEDLQAFV